MAELPGYDAECVLVEKVGCVLGSRIAGRRTARWHERHVDGGIAGSQVNRGEVHTFGADVARTMGRAPPRAARGGQRTRTGDPGRGPSERVHRARALPIPARPPRSTTLSARAGTMRHFTGLRTREYSASSGARCGCGSGHGSNSVRCRDEGAIYGFGQLGEHHHADNAMHRCRGRSRAFRSSRLLRRSRRSGMVQGCTGCWSSTPPT